MLHNCVYASFCFLNITNSPRKYDIKVNMRWNSDESVVTYNRDMYYIFAPEKSIGDPRDYKATILNVPLLVS